MTKTILLKAEKSQHKQLFEWANIIFSQAIAAGKVSSLVEFTTLDDDTLTITGGEREVEAAYWFCFGMRLYMDIMKHREV